MSEKPERERGRERNKMRKMGRIHLVRIANIWRLKLRTGIMHAQFFNKHILVDVMYMWEYVRWMPKHHKPNTQIPSIQIEWWNESSEKRNGINYRAHTIHTHTVWKWKEKKYPRTQGNEAKATEKTWLGIGPWWLFCLCEWWREGCSENQPPHHE